MPRRNWIAPLLTQLRGTDSRAIGNGFESLTSYLRGHIGYWDTATGTTNASGNLTVTHNCGFSPSVAMVSTSTTTVFLVVTGLTETTLTVNARTSGGLYVGSLVVNYHILPKVKER